MTTPDAAAAVSLHGRTPFARGGKRACFLHPAHPDRCIKLPLPDQLPADLRRRAPWHQRLRKPVRAFDENHREWLAARWLERRGDQSVWNHVPRCHGWADTDLGRGLVVSLCRDPGGHVSPNLLDYPNFVTFERRFLADQGFPGFLALRSATHFRWRPEVAVQFWSGR